MAVVARRVRVLVHIVMQLREPEVDRGLHRVRPDERTLQALDRLALSAHNIRGHRGDAACGEGEGEGQDGAEARHQRGTELVCDFGLGVQKYAERTHRPISS